MKYVIGAVTGLLWGALVAWLNSRINKKAIEKNSAGAMMTASILRTAIDVAALAAVFLLRNVLPGNFEATIVGTAASLGLLTVYFAYRLSKPEKKSEEKAKEE
jgi:dipeptide/tripeptide permease